MTTPSPAAISIGTDHGPAAAHVHLVPDARGALVLGHGAGGGVGAPDLLAALRAAQRAGFHVVLVEQPYRVAGRRAPPRAPVLDAAWDVVVEHLREHVTGHLPLVVGGRSSGARVACRTAAGSGAVGVLCLAFPLQPRARAEGRQVPSRLPELDAVPCPVLVVQGDRDPFGVPPSASGRTVVAVRGDHALRGDLAAVGDVVREWLAGLVAGHATAPGTRDGG